MNDAADIATCRISTSVNRAMGKIGKAVEQLDSRRLQKPLAATAETKSSDSKVSCVSKDDGTKSCSIKVPSKATSTVENDSTKTTKASEAAKTEDCAAKMHTDGVKLVAK